MVVIGLCIASFGVAFWIGFAWIGISIALFLPVSFVGMFFEAWLDNIKEKFKEWLYED